jgi:parallel beta-helix repeat protein
VDLTGDDPVVTNNRIDGTASPGFDIECTGASCSGGLISKNRITGSRNAGFRLDIGSDPPSTLVVENNTATDVKEEAFDADCVEGVIFDKNRANGTDDGEDECFDICGSDNTFTNNRADNCAGEGFNISEDNNTLDRNSVKNTLHNGFPINGTGNSLTDNSATDTNGVGFAVESGATNTTLGGNKASKNRVGAYNEGVNTTGISNNSFDQVIPVCPNL